MFWWNELFISMLINPVKYEYIYYKQKKNKKKEAKHSTDIIRSIFRSENLSIDQLKSIALLVSSENHTQKDTIGYWNILISLYIYILIILLKHNDYIQNALSDKIVCVATNSITISLR